MFFFQKYTHRFYPYAVCGTAILQEKFLYFVFGTHSIGLPNKTCLISILSLVLQARMEICDVLTNARSFGNFGASRCQLPLNVLPGKQELKVKINLTNQLSTQTNQHGYASVEDQFNQTCCNS